MYVHMFEKIECRLHLTHRPRLSTWNLFSCKVLKCWVYTRVQDQRDFQKPSDPINWEQNFGPKSFDFTLGSKTKETLEI